MEITYAGTSITCNEEGYLEDYTQWNEEVCKEMAVKEGIELTDRHWEVIYYLRDQFKKEVPLTIRRVGKSGVVSIKEYYQLFPNGPLKISSKLAGIPKPVSCI